MKPIQFIYYPILLIVISSCGLFYDPKLKTPDCCGGGYNLTSLGSLIYGPWQIDPDAINEKVIFNEKELSSIKASYTPTREKLVFELLEDGHVNYWFNSNNSLRQQGPTIVSDQEPKGNDRGQVFKNGKWKANFKDSTLTIDFGKSTFELPSLEGKYLNLGSTSMAIRETTYFDSLYEGEMVKLKRVITTNYTHPWVHN